MAMAPPCWLTMAGSRSGHSARQARLWAANASFSSTASRSSQPSPARAQRAARPRRPARCRRGGAPRRSWPWTRPGRGAAHPRAPRPSSEARSTAEAPSFIGDALPAVTVPPDRNAGRSRPERIHGGLRRGCTRRARAPRPATPTTSASNQPASHAAAAFWCDASAKASWSSRLMRVLVGQDLGALPEGDRPLGRHAGVHHAPAEGGAPQLLVAGRVALGRLEQDPGRPAHALHSSGQHHLGVAHGDGPAGRRSTASSPEPHSRFTVAPGTVTGRPASSTAMRATLRLSSPARWRRRGRPRRSTPDRGLRRRSTMALTAVAARSSGRMPANAPPRRPTGVRTASTTKTSRVMAGLLARRAPPAGGGAGTAGGRNRCVSVPQIAATQEQRAGHRQQAHDDEVHLRPTGGPVARRRSR